MARNIEDYPNTDAPTATFPFGNIRDDTGINDGTPVNKQVYSDTHQFHAKLLSVAGIVGNGLPESELNGFQLNEALKIMPTTTSARVNALHGLFDEPLAAIGEGTIGASAGRALTVYEGEVYVGDDVSIKVFNVITGVLARTLVVTGFDEFRMLQVYNGVLYTVSKRISDGFSFLNVVDPITGATSLSVFLQELFDTGAGMFIRDNRIYLTDDFYVKVFVYNATTGANIPGEEFGSNVNMTSPKGIFLVNDTAYIPDASENSIKIYSVSNLSFQGEITSNFNPNKISIVGDKIYVTNNFGIVFTYSIKTEAGISEDFNGANGAIFIKDNKCFIYDNINNKIEVTQQNTITEYI